MSRGTIALKKGGQVPVELRREVGTDGRMTLTVRVRPPGEDALELRRVFDREP